MAYDREKTLAILTGILCVLVFLAGTVLGGYHAFLTIGVGAGLLALASYGIADVVIAWSSYIDYKESGGAMEWTAWVVKYPLSLYLLVSGGCIAYTMFYAAEQSQGRSAAVSRAAEAQRQCLAAPGSQRGRQVACQKIYDSTLASEDRSLTAKHDAESDSERSIQRFIRYPLFHYIPGLLGLFGMIGLTLVAKLSSAQREPAEPMSPSPALAKLRAASVSAPLVVSGRQSPGVSNGRGATLTVKRNAVRFRRKGVSEKHVCYVSNAESPVLETLDYASLGREALKRRRASVGDDSLCEMIAESL